MHQCTGGRPLGDVPVSRQVIYPGRQPKPRARGGDSGWTSCDAGWLQAVAAGWLQALDAGRSGESRRRPSQGWTDLVSAGTPFWADGRPPANHAGLWGPASKYRGHPTTAGPANGPTPAAANTSSRRPPVRPLGPRPRPRCTLVLCQHRQPMPTLCDAMLATPPFTPLPIRLAAAASASACTAAWRSSQAPACMPGWPIPRSRAGLLPSMMEAAQAISAAQRPMSHTTPAVASCVRKYVWM